MRIYSWNVNGIRAAVRNGLIKTLDGIKADIWCFQEVRADVEHLDEILPFDGFTYSYSTHAEKKGYSGVMTVSKKEPLQVMEGLGIKKFDKEGRVLTTEFENFYLINAYFPNTQRELTRLDYKIEFNNAILKLMNKLDKSKPIIVTGDFNVAHEEMDLANPKENEQHAGFTQEERKSFTKILSKGYLDTFRLMHPKKVKYSWWTYRFGARSRNIGWRIDYFLTSKRLKSKITKAEIHNDVLGSDHCPIELTIDV